MTWHFCYRFLSYILLVSVFLKKIVRITVVFHINYHDDITYERLKTTNINLHKIITTVE